MHACLNLDHFTDGTKQSAVSPAVKEKESQLADPQILQK